MPQKDSKGGSRRQGTALPQLAPGLQANLLAALLTFALLGAGDVLPGVLMLLVLAMEVVAMDMMVVAMEVVEAMTVVVLMMPMVLVMPIVLVKPMVLVMPMMLVMMAMVEVMEVVDAVIEAVMAMEELPHVCPRAFSVAILIVADAVALLGLLQLLAAGQ